MFNQKLERNYAKFSNEIKGNLERGTAMWVTLIQLRGKQQILFRQEESVSLKSISRELLSCRLSLLWWVAFWPINWIERIPRRMFLAGLFY